MKSLFVRRNLRFLILLVVLLTLILAACVPASGTAQGEGPRDECGFIEPSLKDLEKAISFGKPAFASENWVKSYTVEPYKITLTRQNDTDAAIAYTEYLIYTCGYGQDELVQYFNDESFNTVFEEYESHTLADFCEQTDLALYKFDLLNEGTEYIAHYWVKQEDDTHILVMMLVFPKTGTTLLEEYSQKLFPELTTCQ